MRQYNKIVIVVLLFCVASCAKMSKIDPYDTDNGLSKKGYVDMVLGKRKGANNATSNEAVLPPSIPKASKIIIPPTKPKASEEKVISLSVTDDVDLKDVLLEISRLANIDIEIDPEISGGIILSVKNRPLNDVLEKIAELGKLRYTENNGIVKFEVDKPFLKYYYVSFLNSQRSSSSSTSFSTGTPSDAGLTGSQNRISVTTSDDFWKDLTTGVEQIITEDPETEGANRAITINQKAGIVAIVASQRAHKKIDVYLKLLRRKATAQALIEIKVVEVVLKDAYQSGIQWYAFSNSTAKVTSKDGSSTASSVPKFSLAPNGNVATGLITSYNNPIGKAGLLNYAVNFLQQFGTTRTLSSPRITTLNNQQAVLTFADNEVFFRVNVAITNPQFNPTNGTTLLPSQASYTTTMQTIPVGIILTIQPSIDLDKNEILMNVRPTLSKVKNTVQDPGSLIAAKQANLDPSLLPNIGIVPVTETREIDSVLRIKSGDIMVIGGFTDQSNSITENGIPGLSAIPILGYLFKTKTKNIQNTETVIFIKATIIDNDPGVDALDKEFYNTFVRERRQVKF